MTDREIKDKIINGIKDWFDDVDSYSFSDSHQYVVYRINDYDKALVEFTTMIIVDKEVQITTGFLDIDGMVSYFKEPLVFYNQDLFYNWRFMESYFESVVKEKLPNKNTILVNLKQEDK